MARVVVVAVVSVIHIHIHVHVDAVRVYVRQEVGGVGGMVILVWIRLKIARACHSPQQRTYWLFNRQILAEFSEGSYFLLS